MCLAKAYVDAPADQAGAAPMMENVTRVVIDGEKVRLTTLFGETEELTARIEGIDFSEGRLMLRTTVAPHT